MRSFIASSDEVLKIKNFKWRKSTNIPQENPLFKFQSVRDNIAENGSYYLAEHEGDQIFGFLSEISTKAHPLIELSYSSVWYNSNLGGIYLIGFDKANNEYFAPIL